MFSWLPIEKNDWYILSLIAGGLTAAVASQKLWREAAIIMFTGISFVFFTLPALLLLLNWTLNTEVFSSDPVKYALGYLFTLGGNFLALKVIAWWQGMNLVQLIDLLLRRTEKK